MSIGVTLAGGRIAAVGTPPAGVEVIVGAVNAHTHLYSALAPLGLPAPAVPPENFVQILERIWWRLDRALDADSLRASARLGIAEALLAGTTTLVDHHESPGLIDGSLDILAGAADELGIRLITCYGATERNGGRAEAGRGLAECRRLIEGNRRPTVRGMIGLHASFTVSDDTIAEVGALARELDVPVHVHVAEDRADVDDARRRGYAGPLQRLLELGALPAGSVLAHGVHLDRAEVEAAAAAGLWLVQNPRSNEGNRVGYPRALSASHLVALGTDGYPADMAVEAAALARLARAHGDDRSGERPAGGLGIAIQRFDLDFPPVPAVGGAGDLVVRAGGQVRQVYVAGRPVVDDGGLVTADLAEIRAHAAEQAARLWRRMETVP